MYSPSKLFFSFLTLAIVSAAAPLPPADLTRDVTPLVASGALQAVSLGVVQREGAVTAHVGQLSPTNSAAPDDHTFYEIGSITKVFTSLLLADAVVRGEVTLDTTIATLLPSDVVLPEGAGERITLRMLATHTSGLPRIPVEIPTDDFTNPYERYGEAELWASLRTVKLDFEPGTKAGYSNFAAGLLGTLLARKAGASFEELLQTRILRQLGMNETAITLDAAQRARLAPPFTSDGRPWGAWDFAALAGAGAIRSTTADMMRFAQAMLRPEETPLRAAIELAWARQDLAATISGGGQGLGWLLAGDGRTRWHNGMTAGSHAALYVNRELGVASVYLANRANPVGTQLAESLLRRAAGLKDRKIPNADRAEVKLTPEEIDRCTGTFRLSETMVLVCERRDGVLVVTPTGQAADRLFAASPTTFFSRRAPIDLVFELPDDGRPAHAVTLVQGPRRTRAVRE